MKVGFGLITCQRYPGDPRSASDMYSQAIAIARACEDEMLDSVWVSEHHFWDDDYMPSLLVTLGAIAAVTSKITIGTGVLLAPLYDPIRLAEDAATVDLISKGRLILGLGAGWRAEEFDRLGASMNAVGRRMSETVKVLRKAWGPSVFDFDGQALSYGPTNVTPKPSHEIPIWLGGFADDALRRAGRIADGFIGSSTRGDDVAERLSFVKEGLAKSKRDPSTFTFALHYPVWVGDVDEVIDQFHNLRWKYDDMRTEFGRSSDAPLPSPPPLDDERRKALSSSILTGTVEEVASRIRSFRDAVGPDLHFICRSYFPGVSFDAQMRQVKLLGEVRKLSI
ncbi:MAG: LLM class flavin-dependent oxidoreductase [Actinomycetota bacterium]